MQTSTKSFFSKHEFLIRRLHSLSGLVFGAYMCVHLITNASVLAGPRTFQEQVDGIHKLGPALPFVELTFIFAPLLFHAIVGVWISVKSEPNTHAYRYSGNYRYTLQRATGWIAFFGVGWHVFHMHGWIPIESAKEWIRAGGWGAKFLPEAAASSAAMALAPFGYKVFYTVVILASVFHFANGLWTMGITWGVWTTPLAQKRANYPCAAIGAVLALVGLGALYGFSVTDVDSARRDERPERIAVEAANESTAK